MSHAKQTANVTQAARFDGQLGLKQLAKVGGEGFVFSPSDTFEEVNSRREEYFRDFLRIPA